MTAAGLVAGALGVVALAAIGDPLRAVASTGPVLAGDWSADERQAIASAIERLPQTVRQRSPGPVWRDGRRCDSDGLPPDADLVDAGGRIHLCAGRPGVVSHVVPTELPRPRDRLASRALPRYLHLRALLGEALRDAE